MRAEEVLIPPSSYIRAVRQVLGNIDLDPCSSPRAQVAVEANGWYQAEGASAALAEPWSGRVFLHPHANRRTARFQVQKLLRDWLTHRVTAAIILAPGIEWLRLEPLLLSMPFVPHVQRLHHWRWLEETNELERMWPSWNPTTIALPARETANPAHFDAEWLLRFNAGFRRYGRVVLAEAADNDWQQDVARASFRSFIKPVLTHGKIDRHGPS
jgi:hypothetical protein